MKSRPAFTATAVLTLALGLGANSAMFSVIQAALLRPLPYAQPDQLVRIVGFDKAEGVRDNLSPADFLDFQREARTLARMGAHGWIGFFTVLDHTGESERLGGVNVTEGFFPTLGARFALGRAFTAEEDRAGGPRAVILGHAYLAAPLRRRRGRRRSRDHDQRAARDDCRRARRILPSHRIESRA